MSRFILVWLCLAISTGALTASQSDYLAKALREFPSGKIPSDLGFTAEIDRNGHRIRERFDPAQAAPGQWTLLLFAGRAPTPAEIAQHRVARAKGGESASFRADFNASDIDRGSLKLESEDANAAVYTGAFTEEAGDKDGVLARLSLRLTVDKHRAEVIGYELRLLRSFSPVLGVKIHELIAGTEFHRPPGLDMQLPLRTWSRFKGRIFFSSVQEDLEARYSDYTRRAAALVAR